MRLEITDLIRAWVECCNELWVKRFVDMPHGADRFSEEENALFKALVADELGLPLRASGKFEAFGAIYQSELIGTRQVCRRQKAGNIFCKPESVSIEVGAPYRVQSIDPLGTMMDGSPYAEIVYQDGYFLESIDVLRFVVETP